MYLAHFGLSEAPFAITPDTRFLYLSERHRDALAHLLYGAGEGGGFVQLTGEVGTGKTTLCRRFLEQAPAHVDMALILNPRLTGPELLAAICDELQVPYPPAPSAKLLVDALYRHLLEAHARGRRTVLVIDEAQDLPPEVLEDVRLLTNLETPREKLLQIILIGQPELGRMLDRADLRQVSQRITARYHLVPFTLRETAAYIQHRLGVAGIKRLIFDDAAVREVHRAAGGVPRLINIVCDRALLGAYVEDRHAVGRQVVRRAAREALSSPRPRRPRPWLWAAAAAGAMAIAGGAWVTAWPERLPWMPAVLSSYARSLDSPPPATPAPKSTPQLTLVEALADPSLPSDQGAAFASLYGVWGIPYERAGSGLACEHGRADGLRCLVKTGNWNRIRRFDLPAILHLVTQDGGRRYAALVALGNDAATLLFGTRRLTFPIAEVDARWDGSFILLWKPPALAGTTLAPGGRGRDVVWLRQRLDELGGQPPGGDTGDVYDDALRARVTAFQRHHALVADGVVGDETLVRLVTATGNPRVPRLTTIGGDALSRAPTGATSATAR
jgi:general secretion pathway protein A